MKFFKKILLIDNYDSFVYTLAAYLEQLGAETKIVKNDFYDFDRVKDIVNNSSAVLISPGPGKPEEAFGSLKIIEYCSKILKPMLGICLGHQALNEVYGGCTIPYANPMHGRANTTFHNQLDIYKSIPSPILTARYNSLTIDKLGSDLEVTSLDIYDNIMGIKHKKLPLQGVQFHPESILTEYGYTILANWLISLD